MSERRIDADDVVAVYDRLFRQPARVRLTREGSGGTGEGGGDGGPGAVAVEGDGTVVVATATNLNFVGATVIDAGSGRATVTIAGFDADDILTNEDGDVLVNEDGNVLVRD